MSVQLARPRYANSEQPGDIGAVSLKVGPGAGIRVVHEARQIDPRVYSRTRYPVSSALAIASTAGTPASVGQAAREDHGVTGAPQGQAIRRSRTSVWHDAGRLRKSGFRPPPLPR
jgi:hypothetical protein